MAIKVVTIDSVDDMHEYSLRVTRKARVRLGEALAKSESSKPALSPFAARLKKAYERAEFGCQAPHVKEILSAIVQQATGEKVKFTAPGEKYKMYPVAGLAIVPLTNPNSHDYPLGEVCIAINSARACKKDATRGNYLPLILVKDSPIRLATDEEIDEFYTTLPKERYEAFLDAMSIGKFTMPSFGRSIQPEMEEPCQVLD